MNVFRQKLASFHQRYVYANLCNLYVQGLPLAENSVQDGGRAKYFVFVIKHCVSGQRAISALHHQQINSIGFRNNQEGR